MNSFDDIRPYTDAELPEAMQRIAEWELFPQIIRFIYPDMEVSEARRRLLDTRNIHQFQATFMNDAIRRIVKETTDGFTFSGLHHLRRGVPYLFISNHRDITLDAFLLQHLLMEHRDTTSHIVFGQNLLSLPIMEVLFRSNKLIRMERGGSPRAFYNSLHHLSDYLNHLVNEERQSVWIAQKNGRAKDGCDTTAPAMIKMLTLGGKGDPLQTLNDLNIVPLSISYEWDPCDVMKANELMQSRYGSYTKAPDEDLRSVVGGIIGPKGHVHLTIGAPLKPRELQPPAGVDLADHVAALLDRRILHGYKLMPTNYAAYTLVTGRRLPAHYTQRTLDRLKARAEALPAEAQRILFEAYANPVLATKR
ncbi:MAG: 1-acyl-sn-glycerol-3-phosphate acyltransferase [Bacteroidales bacterium]|nr:1-acyl-sn-glycerol-3-phosphate acyltransferase [Bacteroidales bacterium]